LEYHRKSLLMIFSPETRADSLQGETKYEWVRNSKGKLQKRRLSYKERAHMQRQFYDTRVGHGVCGDDWMRKDLPKRAP
jgi:hypothetical protein